MQFENDGYVPFMEYKTYFKVFGKSNVKKTPLLVLHGGPGSAHNYLLGLAELSKTGRQVIFYDQLGGGLSDHPLNSRIWSFDLFIKELESVRDYLKLSSIILYGHSWGGMLAAEYMCEQKPQGIERLILASSMVSMPLYRTEVEILKKSLPAKDYEILKKHEKAGTTDTNEYLNAMKEYNERHILKLPVMPGELRDPPNTFGKVPYKKLWGASEAYPDGLLKNWSRLDDLRKVTVPSLVISGQYDELTPAQAIATMNKLSNAKLEIITGGTHLAHVEYPEAYLSALQRFFDD